MRSGITLTAALAWYDEPPDMLQRCIHSLRGLADRIIAVDGGYTLIDGAKAKSPAAQARAIRDAAIEIDAEVYIHQPNTVWKGQVEKRDWMMRTAGKNTDWILVVDADYQIICPQPDRVRRELRHTTADSLAIDLHTPMPPGEPGPEIFPHSWHENLAGRTVKTHLLFRALPEMQVEKHHWWYSGLKNGRRVALWGCKDLYPPARQKRLRTPLRIDHHCLTRPQALIDRNRDYIERRGAIVKATGLEP